MRPPGERRIIVLAEGGFEINEAKTAVGVMRYGRDRTLAVVDSQHTGKMAADVVGTGAGVPIVDSVQAALDLTCSDAPNTLLLGTAPRGGALPPAWRAEIARAMRAGLDVVNGLHAFLADDSELSPIARQAGVDIWDVRRPPESHRVADTRAHALPATVVLAVGSDCNVGKMSTMLEIDALVRRRAAEAASGRTRRSVFVPTGQTGILIAGWGVALDEVISDFTAGAAEDLVMQAAAECPERGDLILVEGQGSLIHPGYSGVTLSLVHGSAPDAMILCHQATRTTIRRYTLPIPPYARLIRLYEDVTEPVKPARVIALSLNTFGMPDADARAALDRATGETGLPATDPVRYGAAPLLDAIERFSDTLPPKGVPL